MQIKATVFALAAASGVMSQRPADTPICDYYTTALLMNNTAENQYTLLTLLVNTVVIGNYTKPNTGVAVPGILAAGTFNGEKVNLLPYFNGMLASTNRGGSSGVSVNSLDGGGAVPIMKNMPADSMTSNQYFLLTHLYQFFGSLLGCSKYGMGPAFPAYTAKASMYEVHKFMDLNAAEVGYFIQQVALAGASFGVTESDLTAVGTALNGLFGYRCSPPAAAIAAQGPQLHAICIEDSCPLSPNATCASYAPAVEPLKATSTAPGGGMGNATASPTTGKSTPTPTVIATAGAVATGVSLFAVAGGFAALLL